MPNFWISASLGRRPALKMILPLGATVKSWAEMPNETSASDCRPCSDCAQIVSAWTM